MRRLVWALAVWTAATQALAASDGKPCAKVGVGNDLKDISAKGSAFAVRYGVKPGTAVGKMTFANGTFEMCLPKGRYSIAVNASDNRWGTVDIDLTRDKETFVYLDNQTMSGERVEQCMAPPASTPPAMPACAPQRATACAIRGEVKDAAGQAKPFARVSVIIDRGTCYQADMDLDGEVTNLVTDAKGQFELAGLACYAATVMTWTASTCQSTYVTFTQPGTLTVPLVAKD